MKIATWNLDGARPHGRERTTYVRQQLAQVLADVWVLTESYPDFHPGEGYACLATSSVEAYRTVGCWVAIWARAGISGRAYEMSQEVDRAAGALIQHPDGAKLWVFGTVLPWRSDTRHSTLRGAAAFVVALRAQAEQWRAARASEVGSELCVAGDFNQEVGHKGWVGTKRGAEALDQVLHDDHLTCVTGGKLDPLQARSYGTSIDHVLLSDGLRLRGKVLIWPECAALPKDAPDHHGVCVGVGVA